MGSSRRGGDDFQVVSTWCEAATHTAKHTHTHIQTHTNTHTHTYKHEGRTDSLSLAGAYTHRTAMLKQHDTTSRRCGVTSCPGAGLSILKVHAEAAVEAALVLVHTRQKVKELPALELARWKRCCCVWQERRMRGRVDGGGAGCMLCGAVGHWKGMG